VGFEPTIPGNERPQNHARDRAVPEIGPDEFSACLFGTRVLHVSVWVGEEVHVFEKRPKYPDMCLLPVQIKFLRFCIVFFTCQGPGLMSGHRRVSNNNSCNHIDVLPCSQATPFCSDASRFEISLSSKAKVLVVQPVIKFY